MSGGHGPASCQPQLFDRLVPNIYVKPLGVINRVFDYAHLLNKGTCGRKRNGNPIVLTRANKRPNRVFPRPFRSDSVQ